MERLKRLRSELTRWLPGRTGIDSIPHEHTNMQLAKLVRAHRLGEFTLGHYQSNSAEPPDHVTTQVLRSRSATDDDFETVSWTVTPVTPPQRPSLPERPHRRAASGHLLALSGPAGVIVLSEFLDEAEAERAMEAVAAVQPPAPPQPSDCVTNYPVTREEVRLLAAHWIKVCLDAASCVRQEADGTAGEETLEYSTDRVRLAEAVLGRDEVQAVEREIHARFCHSYYERGEDDIGDEPDH